MEAMLPTIQTLMTTELKALEAYLCTVLAGEGQWLHQLIEHLLKHPGKQLRSRLVLLAAGASGGITAKTRRGAALVTLFHHASLIHDDVVDEATHRRGTRSINALWNNKVAILFGDYLLAKGLRIAVEHQDDDFLDIISSTMQAMSKGELLQLEKARQLAITEVEYLHIIQQKTAQFIAACCTIGALSANASADQAAMLGKIGEHLGMAFQIRDDLLDYNSAANLGKDTGVDIKERKITLPLLYALQQATEEDRQKILHSLKNHSQEPEKVQAVMTFVHTSGGIGYAQEKMYDYREQALQLLATCLRPSPYKEAFTSLINQTINAKS